MVTRSVPLSLLVAHFIGDFPLQTDQMALGKSKNRQDLTDHVFVYSLCFLFWGLPFACVTFLTHWITDYFTSRATSKLWFFRPTGVFFNAGGDRSEMWIPKGGSRHWFFVMIGFDQLIHFTTLALTYHYVIR